MCSPTSRTLRRRTLVPRADDPRPAVVFGAVGLLLLALVAARWAPLVALDRRVARGLHSAAVAEDGFTEANRILTDWVWDPWTMRLLLLAAVLWLAWRGQRPLALWLSGTLAVGTALQQGLKAAVGRDRPSWPDPVDSASYAAFPSGHAMTATMVCGLLLWLLGRYAVPAAARRAAWAVAAVSVAGVGFTRMWLGVHWTTDVAGGWLLGAAVAAAAAAAYGRTSLPARDGRARITE